MSRTLNLCEHLLYQGRRYSSLGSIGVPCAPRPPRPLAELPLDIAEETQLHLAELLLKQRQFAKARRHLAAALAYDPGNPEYHYLLALSHEEDPRGDRQLALRHYRRCVELDPEHPGYHSDAGQFLVKHAAVQEGLNYLRRAAELAPADAEIIGDVVRCLLENELFDEARDIARSAFFRRSRDPRFQRLWNDFRFQELHQQQERLQHRRRVHRAVGREES